MSDQTAADLTGLAADIVSAYVTKNAVPVGELPGLIASVHAALRGLTAPKEEPPKLEPAVPIRKSVTPDYLISLEDGKKYKTLKRHLTGLGLTPDEYRKKWGLPPDYPMVAPSYAERRSELARATGLGQKRKKASAAKAAAEPKVSASVQAPKPKRAARKKASS